MGFQSESIISAASQKFGVIDYSRWQAIRWQWYSYVTYPTAGVGELNFFGQVAGQAGVGLGGLDDRRGRGDEPVVALGLGQRRDRPAANVALAAGAPLPCFIGNGIRGANATEDTSRL